MDSPAVHDGTPVRIETPTDRLNSGIPVTFDCQGSRLFGSLHRASASAPGGIGVILLNQGPVDRAGSHRLYIKLANRLASLGFIVLRFDARGVGESEGAWEGEENRISVPEVYSRIQQGAWKPDALAAIDYMRRDVGVDRIVLGGLCGGAATALLTGAEHPSVDGLFAIGTPITFAHETRLTAVPNAILQQEVSGYFRKLLRPSSWTRFLSFKTDYRTLARVLSIQLQRRLAALRQPATAAFDDDNDVNVALVRDILTAARRKPLLVVFSGNDYLWREFQEHLPRFGKDPSRLPFELVTIPDANHIFTQESWQQALSESVTSWLKRTQSESHRRWT